MKHKNVVVFIPKTGFRSSYESKFVESFVAAKDYLLAKANDIPFTFTISQYFSHTFPIDANRNECISMAIKNNIDVAIFLDTDHMIPSDALLKLIKHDLPVVAGVYYGKGEPFAPIVFKENEDSADFDLFSVIYKIGDKTIYKYEDLFPASMVGGGCFAISLDVMKKLEKPFWKYRPLPRGLLTDENKKQFSGNSELEKELKETLENWTADNRFKIDNDVHSATEDVWFWRNVKKAGYQLMVDPTIILPHGPIDMWVDKGISEHWYKLRVANSEKIEKCAITDPKKHVDNHTEMIAEKHHNKKKANKIPTNGGFENATDFDKDGKSRLEKALRR